jgi:glyoxylase-like metal-dependent hydrolase (beta-lactamase superfamily II)
MEQVVDGLFASSPMPLPVGRSTSMRAFLCRRPAGNLVIYGSPALADERDDIERLGGAWRHYLTHSHETEFFAEAVGDGPFIHVADSEVLAHAHARHRTFAGRHVLGEDFQLIPTPGHTPGNTSYLWDTGQERILFSGDTLFLRDGEWQAAVLTSSDRPSFIESLELILGLEFDILAPWIAGADQAFWTRTDPADAERRIDALVRQIKGVRP